MVMRLIAKVLVTMMVLSSCFIQVFSVPLDYQEFNHLNWVEVSENKVSKQIMFDFSQPIHFQKNVISEKSQLVLSFPGIDFKNFNSNKVKLEIEKLKTCGMLHDIEIKSDLGVVPAMKLVLTFAPLRLEKIVDNGKEVLKNVKNQLSIKWSKVDKQKTNKTSYRLILDIFTKEVLDSIEQHNSILLQAHNGFSDKKKIYA